MIYSKIPTKDTCRKQCTTWIVPEKFSFRCRTILRTEFFGVRGSARTRANTLSTVFWKNQPLDFFYSLFEIIRCLKLKSRQSFFQRSSPVEDLLDCSWEQKPPPSKVCDQSQIDRWSTGREFWWMRLRANEYI